MITRIEIDGFKSFLDFTLDVPPLLALIGPTSGGKSNLFDAMDYEAAARGGRPALLESRRGRPHELVHRVAKGRPVDGFSIARWSSWTLWCAPIRAMSGCPGCPG